MIEKRAYKTCKREEREKFTEHLFSGGYDYKVIESVRDYKPERGMGRVFHTKGTSVAVNEDHGSHPVQIYGEEKDIEEAVKCLENLTGIKLEEVIN